MKYNLLSKYTSFLAVDNQVRTGEENQTIIQALPLPQNKRSKAQSLSLNNRSVTRATVAAQINVLLPKACTVFEDKVTIKWELTWNSEFVETDPDISYVFTINDPFGKKILSKETDKPFIEIDFSKDIFKGAPTLIYNVAIKGSENIVSDNNAIKKLKASQTESVKSKINELSKDTSENGLLALANYLESQKLFANATAVYDQLLNSTKDKDQANFLFDEFLARNQLKK